MLRRVLQEALLIDRVCRWELKSEEKEKEASGGS
jgi:hypothetical protein